MTARTKKFLAVVLTMTMVFSVMGLGLSSKPETAEISAEKALAPANGVSSDSDDTLYPTIILPGINHSPSYLCDEDGNRVKDSSGNDIGGGLLIIDNSNLVKRIVKKLLFPLLAAIFLKADVGLDKAVYDTVCDLFYVQKVNNDGTPANNLVCKSFDGPLSSFSEDDNAWFYRMLPMQEVVSSIESTYGVANGEDYVYLYTFPLVGDPMEAGRGLVDYIENVKKQNNCDKVNLVTVSLGGTVLDAYCQTIADNYNGDFSNINRIINIVSCLDGTEIIGDFYGRNWNLDDTFLYHDYIPAVMEANGSDRAVGHLINIALRLLPKPCLYAILTAAMDGILDTILINDAQMWAMVPSDRYEALADRYLSDDDHAVLREKTDAFQEARVNLKSNLACAKAQGVDVYTLSGYGLTYLDGTYNFFGIVASTAKTNSDAVIPVVSTSIGATTAKAGKSLGYENAYTSPDGSVDASTCFSPDTTWFFTNQHHEIGYNDVAIKLCGKLLTGEIKDINSDPEFSQWLIARNTKQLKRWVFPDAENMMANEDGKYTDEQIAEVKTAYDAAKAVYADTVSGQDVVDKVTQDLRQALVNVGYSQASSSSGQSWFQRMFYKFVTWLDDVIMDTVGGRGYFDKILFWNNK